MLNNIISKVTECNDAQVLRKWLNNVKEIKIKSVGGGYFKLFLEIIIGSQLDKVKYNEKQ